MVASRTQLSEATKATAIEPQKQELLCSASRTPQVQYQRQTPPSSHRAHPGVLGCAHVCFMVFDTECVWVCACVHVLCYLCLHKQRCTKILAMCIHGHMSMQPCEYVSECLHLSESQCACGSQTEITGQKHWRSNLGQAPLVTARRYRCKERRGWGEIILVTIHKRTAMWIFIF